MAARKRVRVKSHVKDVKPGRGVKRKRIKSYTRKKWGEKQMAKKRKAAKKKRK